MNEKIFGCMGVCHRQAPLAVREKVSFTDSKKIDMWRDLLAVGVEQCMILSTCNRSEIFYFYDPKKTDPARIRQCYRLAFPDVEIGEYLVEREDKEAFSYLFRVSAGLESLVLGEDQILGQVGEAMDFARTMGHGGKELNKVVREAVTCAKKIKTTYPISEQPLSVSYVGIRMLERCGGISGKHVLVIGSGKTAALALTYLCGYGAAKVELCSRTLSHAEDLRRACPQVEVISYEERYNSIKNCDIVVTATSSPHTVIKKEPWLEAEKTAEKKKKSVIFLDLASPRDVDPAIADSEGVRIIDLDILQQMTERNKKERERLAKACEEEIQTAVEELSAWLLSSHVDETIETLQKRCQRIADDSYGYLNRKLDLNKREKKILRKVMNASLQRMIREPIQELKQLRDPGEQKEYQKVMQHLFRMDEEGEE